MTHGTIVDDANHDVDLLATSASASMKMSQVPTDDSDRSVIELTKDDYGFGFNVVGGTDNEYIPGDSGIFVSLIKEDGVAERDGRLQQGDKILSVNGVDITSKTHDEAVKILREADDKATLVVQPRAEYDIVVGVLEKAQTPVIPPEDPPQPRSRPNGLCNPDVVRVVQITPAASKREEDEESLYAPSTHSIIDDVPRTPRKKKSVLERATPLLTEMAYVGIGLAAISLFSFIAYKFVVRRRS